MPANPTNLKTESRLMAKQSGSAVGGISCIVTMVQQVGLSDLANKIKDYRLNLNYRKVRNTYFQHKCIPTIAWNILIPKKKKSYICLKIKFKWYLVLLSDRLNRASCSD